MTKKKPLVSVIMGSHSDWPVMEPATGILQAFDIPYEVKVVSAHRTPQMMQKYALAAHKQGIKLIIAGAGGSAHLPGMVASLTHLPVIGVPVMTKTLKGWDSLLSIVQMPTGVPVATVAIDSAHNAGLLAVRILALTKPLLTRKLQLYQKKQKKLSQTSFPSKKRKK